LKDSRSGGVNRDRTIRFSVSASGRTADLLWGGFDRLVVTPKPKPHRTSGRVLVAHDPYARLVLISARIVHHGRYGVFQLANVVSRALFAEILRRIDPLRPRPLLT
jgi:hypothetical protein